MGAPLNMLHSFPVSPVYLAKSKASCILCKLYVPFETHPLEKVHFKYCYEHFSIRIARVFGGELRTTPKPTPKEIRTEEWMQVFRRFRLPELMRD